MAHEVETMMFHGAAPWHGLGTPISDELQYDLGQAIEAAGLNWTVERIPLMTCDSQVIVERWATRRTSDSAILGTVGAQYQVVQNARAFDMFAPLVTSRQAALHTAGSLRGGSRVWILARLNRDPMMIAPGDAVEKYLLLSHSHDGSLAVRIGFTPVRVVCANTLAMAHGSAASKLLRFRHTAGVEASMTAAFEAVNAANAEFEATADAYRLLARTAVSVEDVKRYVKIVLGYEGELSAKAKNQIERVAELVEVGAGNRAVRGSLWAAYNGVTDYLSHYAGRNNDSRLNALWYGDGARTNARALEVALDMAK